MQNVLNVMSTINMIFSKEKILQYKDYSSCEPLHIMNIFIISQAHGNPIPLNKTTNITLLDLSAPLK